MEATQVPKTRLDVEKRKPTEMAGLILTKEEKFFSMGSSNLQHPAAANLFGDRVLARHFLLLDGVEKK